MVRERKGREGKGRENIKGTEGAQGVVGLGEVG